MIQAVILANELAEDHKFWIKACDEYKSKIAYRVVDLTCNDWLRDIQSTSFDILLAKPGGLSSQLKQLYDERIYILGKILNYKLYPSAEEIFIYENKRFLSFMLAANEIPHPKTYVFYNSYEAQQFLKDSKYPIIAKTNIGASGSGVYVLKSNSEVIKYLKDTFSGKGAWQRVGPNFEKGGILKRGIHYIFNPGDIIKKLKIYKVIGDDRQKGFVIFQEFINHEFEWRVVRIGDSFFAHKKLKIGEKASGSTLKNYDNPPLDLLSFAKSITDKHGFYSQALDVFETDNKQYLVNEMQCIFGQSDAYQMLVDGVPGRYRFISNAWVFEEGNFNQNESYNLRIDWIIRSWK